MGLEAVVLSVTQITAVVAMGVFLWQIFSRRFDEVDARFNSLETKVEDLAKDHQNLARELSEFRGEVRARLDALPQAPLDP